MRAHADLNLFVAVQAGSRDAIDPPAASVRVLPRPDHKASLLKSAQQWIHRVGIDRHDRTGHEFYALHQPVAVLWTLGKQMKDEQRHDGFSLDRPAEDRRAEDGVLGRHAITSNNHTNRILRV